MRRQKQKQKEQQQNVSVKESFALRSQSRALVDGSVDVNVAVGVKWENYWSSTFLHAHYKKAAAAASVNAYVYECVCVCVFVEGEHMLTALKINVQIVYYVVEFAFFAVGATHTHNRVCVCFEFWWLLTTQSLQQFQDFFLFFYFIFLIFFAFDFAGRFQLVDWESKTIFMLFPSFFFHVYEAFLLNFVEFVAFFKCCLVFLAVFIACLHSWCAWWTFSRTFASCQRQQNVKCVAIANEKWPHDILKLVILTKHKVSQVEINLFLNDFSRK